MTRTPTQPDHAVSLQKPVPTKQSVTIGSPTLTVLETGLIYRNPTPHLRSEHAYYPSLTVLDRDELLASFVIGSAMESTDCQVYLSRSRDKGNTWSLPIKLHEKSPQHTETCRLTVTHDGQIVLLLSESQRLDPAIGATNPVNLGHVPTRMSLLRSINGGSTWGNVESLQPPLIGPTFELCSPIVELSNGRWLLPTSTWRGWDGDAPNGMKAVAFVSEDCGTSWPRHVDVMNRVDDRILFWEQKICEIGGERLLAVAWVYDEKTRTDLPNHFAVARSDALVFSKPQPTHLHGQTPELLHLEDNRILCVYRRTDEPGLWACVVEIDHDDQWQPLYDQCLWSPVMPSARRDGQSLTEEFRGLKLGAPSLVRVDATTILLAFWCVEDSVANIRWVRLRYNKTKMANDNA